MKKESILVVEDEDIMRESLVDWFSSEDHKVDAAADGDNALKDINLDDSRPQAARPRWTFSIK